VMVLVVAVAVVGVELLYFKRDLLEETVVPIEEERIDGAVDDATDYLPGAE
jgi:hypothetical protein